MSETLYVAAAVSNPLLWQSRGRLARSAILDWIREPNVHVFIGEVVYGSRGYELADLTGPQVTHVPLRATTMAWSKECVLNLVVGRMPHNAAKIAFFDADITFRGPYADKIIHALDLYPVIQPWTTCYDLGPYDDHIQVHKSFASIFHSGARVTLPAKGDKWGWNGVGPYIHPHPGFAWAWQRAVLERVGGMFEVGGMGSADHHMALGISGNYEYSLPGGVSKPYRDAVAQWSQRAVTHVNFKLGFCHGTIEHPFHGRKGDRGYESRWQMFLDSGFDPITDLKRNTYGVIEFSGAKPNLERAFDRYMRSREEDVNTLT